MDDWTFTFRQDNLSTIQKLFAANGVPDRVDCRYYKTEHIYDKQKREATYEWMERWVHGRPDGPVKEPDDSKPFSVKTIQSLAMKAPGNQRISADAAGSIWTYYCGRDLSEISRIFSRRWHYQPPTITGLAEWRNYRDRMTAALKNLLGEDAALPRNAQICWDMPEQQGDVIVQRVDYPSEGPVLAPTLVLSRRMRAAAGRKCRSW